DDAEEAGDEAVEEERKDDEGDESQHRSHGPELRVSHVSAPVVSGTSGAAILASMERPAAGTRNGGRGGFRSKPCFRICASARGTFGRPPDSPRSRSSPWRSASAPMPRCSAS